MQQSRSAPVVPSIAAGDAKFAPAKSDPSRSKERKARFLPAFLHQHSTEPSTENRQSVIPENREHDLYEFHADTTHGLPDDLAVMNMPIASDHEIERFGKAQRAFDLEARALIGQIAHRATDSSGAIELNRAALEDPASRRDPAFVHGSPHPRMKEAYPASNARHLFQRF
jgi:hypothetical protein